MTPIETLATDVTTQLKKLNTFGTAEQIRDYFVQEQILGDHLCPVANYLRRELNYPTLASILVVGTSHTCIKRGLGGYCRYIPHHAPILEFIRNFDGNQYPELRHPEWPVPPKKENSCHER